MTHDYITQRKLSTPETSKVGIFLVLVVGKILLILTHG